MLLPSFYERDDVVLIAQELLGKVLFSRMDGVLTGGIITETEAYRGPTDRACHAYNNRKTPRTQVMFENGGVAYVYLCYGMHYLFNVVTAKPGMPHAVLIRSLKPTHGLETMRLRRRNKNPLTKGPGALCQALGITKEHYGYSLTQEPLWIEEGVHVDNIHATKRIGVDYAGKDADLLWRFLLELAP